LVPFLPPLVCSGDHFLPLHPIGSLLFVITSGFPPLTPRPVSQNFAKPFFLFEIRVFASPPCKGSLVLPPPSFFHCKRVSFQRRFTTHRLHRVRFPLFFPSISPVELPAALTSPFLLAFQPHSFPIILPCSSYGRHPPSFLFSPIESTLFGKTETPPRFPFLRRWPLPQPFFFFFKGD